MTKAFVFSNDNSIKGSFILENENELATAFRNYFSQTTILPFDYIGCFGKTWTVILGSNGTSLVEGRIKYDHEEAQKQQAAAKQSAEEAEGTPIKKLIAIFKEAGPESLSFSDLNKVINNHFSFPQMDENTLGAEIFALRRELYMLSLWHPNLQTIIQTQTVSRKLDKLQKEIGDNLSAKIDALQKAITGSAGAPQTTSGQPKWAPLATSVALSKLSNIEKDVDDVADGFFGGD